MGCSRTTGLVKVKGLVSVWMKVALTGLSSVSLDYQLHGLAKLREGHHIFMNGLLFVSQLVQVVFSLVDTAGDEGVVSKIGGGEFVVVKDLVG